MSAPDHCVVVAAKVDPETPGAHFKCQHCGAREPITFPMKIDAFTKATTWFIKRHRGCRQPAKEV